MTRNALFFEGFTFRVVAVAGTDALDIYSVRFANAFDIENALVGGTVNMAVRARAGRVRGVRKALGFFEEAVTAGLTGLFCIGASDADILQTAFAFRVVNAGVSAA